MAHFMLLFIWVLFLEYSLAQVYNVRNFNATGDGKTDDTAAVRAALTAASHSNGGRVVFDSGYTFFTGALNVTSNVILDVRGTILASINPDEFHYPRIPGLPWYAPGGLTKQPIIYIYNGTNITFTGGGTIDGNGPYWYPCEFNATNPPCNPYGRPRLVQPTYSSNLVFENIWLKDSPFWTLHLAWTTNVYINNLTITSPPGILISRAGGYNTDGIDIDCSVNVTVENCYISTADDAVVVKSGYNSYGRKNGRTSENIMVRNINVGVSNGMAIGSESATGARNVTFQDIVLNGSLHAILLKTAIGRGGTVQDITFQNFQIYNTNYTLEFNMYYSQPDNDTTMPHIKNIIVNNVTSDNTDYAYNILGLWNDAIQNVYFSNINVTNIRKGVTDLCQNITGICDSSNVFPQCPSCLVAEACFDASSDCLQYVSLCKQPTYHATLCDLCRKTCGLCNSC